MKTNVKSSSMLQKAMATLLCLCMLLTLMPVFPASAAEETTAVEIAGTDGQKMNVPTGFSGLLYRYETTTTSKGLTLAKVTASMYNITEPLDNFDAYFKYDTSKVQIVSSTGGKMKTGGAAANQIKAVNLTEDLDPDGNGGAFFGTGGLFTTAAPAVDIDKGTIYVTYGGGNGEVYTSVAWEEDPMYIVIPNDKIYDMYTIHFAGIADDEDASPASIPSDMGNFLTLDTTANTINFPEGYGVLSNEGKIAGISARFDESFPVATTPEVTKYTVPFKVQAPQSTNGLYPVSVAITDADGNAVDGSPFSTGTDGTFSVKLPAATGYKYTATYTPDESSEITNVKVLDGTFDVVAPLEGDTLDTKIIQMEYNAAGTYTINFKVVDGDNFNAPIEKAEVKLDTTPLTTNGDGLAVFSELNAATYPLQVTATGYEPYAETTANVTVSADGVTIEDGYAGKFAYDAATKTVTLVMSSEKTKITIPVPVPTDGEGNAMTAAEAGNLRVTISANTAGTTPATLSLPITISTTADNDGNALEVTSGEDGAISAINAVVNLPKGNYTVTIAGAGIEDTTTTLNVVPSSTTTNVNIGGEVAGGTVTGGYTDSGTGEVNLGENSGSATTGGTIDATGALGGEPETATGGALENSGASKLTAVNEIKEPLYYVTGAFNTAMTEMNVSVYLKNINASMGTFALKYDTNIFSFVKYQLENNLQTRELSLTNTPLSTGTALANPDAGANYHSVSWTVGDDASSLDSYLDTTTEAKLIATYTLNVNIDKALIPTRMHNQAIYLMPYDQTANGETLIKYYTDNNATEHIPVMMEEYWRDLDNETENEFGDLDKSLALENGFFQVYTNDADNENIANNADVRTQFVSEDYDYGNVAAKVTVVDGDGAPLGGVDVNVYPGGTPSISGVTPSLKVQTDSKGEAVFAWPANAAVDLQFTKDGYLPNPMDGTSTIGKTTLDGPTDLGEFTLTTQEGHPVVLDTTTDGYADLLGNAKAYNNLDYYFSLTPAPGYVWADGMPEPSELTITLEDVNNDIDPADETLTATWDADSNRYKIDGTTIKGDPVSGQIDAGKITISFDQSLVKQPTEDAERFTITATAGAGGSVTHVDSEAAGSTFDTTTTPGTIVETLATGKTTSATYTFTPNPDADGNDYVIDKVLINGVATSITDLERQNGYDYQFTNVAANQTIVVTFGIKDPETGEIDPVDNNAIVSVTVGDYGTAALSNAATANLTGPASGTYLVSEAGTLEIAVNATQNVTQPDGTTKNYVVDQVLVNGVKVNTGADNHWSGTASNTFTETTAGTLYLRPDDLVAGQQVDVVITFRVAKESDTDEPVSMQAVVQTSVADGQGSVVAAGTSTYTVGDTPSFTITPLDTTWEVTSIKVTDPDGVVTPVDLSTGLAAGGTYTVPALKAGITTLEVEFAEKTNKLALEIDLDEYNQGINPNKADNPVVVTFTRTAGGDAIDLPFTGTANLGKASVDAYVPQGTWTVTVTKRGYLKYIITDFTIKANGEVDGTYSSNNTTYFGTKTDDAVADAKDIVMTIGDASWDGKLVSLDDVAQVVNGMLVTAGAAQKDRANFTEETPIDLLGDMSFVKQHYGAWYTTTTYADFLAAAAATN